MERDKEALRLKNFFSTVKVLLEEKIFKQYNWSFIPETDVYVVNSDNIKTPLITYKVYHRQPIDGRTGKKPVWKGEYQDPNDRSQIITINSQQFDNIVEFGFWGSSYQEADDARELFEDFIWNYLGKFRKDGILDIYFIEQIEDQVVNVKEQYFAKQTVRYGIRNEREMIFKHAKLNEIETNLRGPDGYEAIKTKLFLS